MSTAALYGWGTTRQPKLTRADLQTIEYELRLGESPHCLAAKYNVCVQTIARIGRGQDSRQRAPIIHRERDPDHAEIAEASAEIQAGWSEVEKAARWRLAHSLLTDPADALALMAEGA